MTPPDALEENLYELDEERLIAKQVMTLPGSLKEALDCLADDPEIQDALGAHVYDRFVAAKMQEWDDFRIQVSGWEVDRYLGIY